MSQQRNKSINQSCISKYSDLTLALQTLMNTTYALMRWVPHKVRPLLTHVFVACDVEGDVCSWGENALALLLLRVLRHDEICTSACHILAMCDVESNAWRRCNFITLSHWPFCLSQCCDIAVWSIVLFPFVSALLLYVYLNFRIQLSDDSSSSPDRFTVMDYILSKCWAKKMFFYHIGTNLITNRCKFN